MSHRQNAYLPAGCEDSDPRAPWNLPDADQEHLLCEDCDKRIEQSALEPGDPVLCDHCAVGLSEECGDWSPLTIAAALRIGHVVAHHAIGATALVEMHVNGTAHTTAVHLCTVTGTVSALDRPYRLTVRLADGREVGPCAPECVIPAHLPAV